MNDFELYDDSAEYEAAQDRAEARAARRGFGGCRCFAPGEAAGSCPGPDQCPIANDEDPS